MIIIKVESGDWCLESMLIYANITCNSRHQVYFLRENVVNVNVVNKRTLFNKLILASPVINFIRTYQLVNYVVQPSSNLLCSDVKYNNMIILT